jgi:hypothetical protein
VLRLLSLPLLLALTGTALAQYPAKAHMEGCLVWRAAQGSLVVGNECSRPITFMFMSFDDGHVTQSEIAPGGVLDTGGHAGDGKFMFTACPVGFVPSLRFAIENKQAISDSLYNCQPGRPDA